MIGESISKELHGATIEKQDEIMSEIGKSLDELERYIKNIYYVLLSRGIKGTYIYVCNKELRYYIEKYISVFTKEDLRSIQSIGENK